MRNYDKGTIKYTGENAEDVTETLQIAFYESDMIVDGIYNAKNNRILITIAYENTKNINHTLVVEPGDLVKYDVDDKRIYIGTDEDVSNDENDTIIEVMSLFGVSREEAKRIANDVDEAIKTFSNELTRSKKPKSSSLFGKRKEKSFNLKNKAKSIVQGVYDTTDAAANFVTGKYQAHQQKEQDVFNQLRNNNSYDGLSDDELRRLIRNRMIFK